MGAPMTSADSSATHRLLEAVGEGDSRALDELLTHHRDYLGRVIARHIDVQLQGRIDPSDIEQDTLVAASRRMEDFLTRRPTTFRIWLRHQAIERLIDARRQHLRLKRDARRDTAVNDASSMAIAAGLLGNRPNEHLMRGEVIELVQQAMSTLAEPDREVLLLRHGEQLSNGEAAEILNISSAAASKRYGRALAHLGVELRRLGVSQF